MTTAIATLLTLLIISQTADAIMNRPQSCSGVLTMSADGEYNLKPDPCSSPWCDAITSKGEYGWRESSSIGMGTA